MVKDGYLHCKCGKKLQEIHKNNILKYEPYCKGCARCNDTVYIIDCEEVSEEEFLERLGKEVVDKSILF